MLIFILLSTVDYLLENVDREEKEVYGNIWKYTLVNEASLQIKEGLSFPKTKMGEASGCLQ